MQPSCSTCKIRAAGRNRRRFVLGLLGLLLPLGGSLAAKSPPVLEARAAPVLREDGVRFKDLNKNGRLDPYEDWRRAVPERVSDLLSRMNLEEKAGMMLIDTLNADVDGRLSDQAAKLVHGEKMTRFIFRNPIARVPRVRAEWGWGGPEITPAAAARFLNSMQEMAEGNRLGIPLLFKSNARNHYDAAARVGINVSAGAFSEWPKEAGLAATRDLELIGEFARVMRREWSAIGLRSMYGYMADLATEPRWYRVHETFTEDADLAAAIMRTLVTGLQGAELGPDSIALTMKHFPGGGPQEGGGDPHYAYGRNQVYPAGNFEYHLRPFQAAIEAGLSSIMPYYGIPVGQEHQPNDVGMAFSKGIVTDLLRGKLGFAGYVNSDTGIITDRAWGLEDKSVEERLQIAIEAGTDVLSGFHEKAVILDLVASGRLSEARLDLSVRRLLSEQFQLGLFENPYVDPDRAETTVGHDAHQRLARYAQRKSVVLLENRRDLLPLRRPAPGRPVVLYTLNLDPTVFSSEDGGGYTVVPGDGPSGDGPGRRPVPADTDYAVIRVEVTNQGAGMFGGALEEELDLLAFSEMAAAKSWVITPSLADIQATMQAVGRERTVLCIYFRQPFVLDEASGLRQAGALVATFGVRDAALRDVLTGAFAPQGRLPFALANSSDAIRRQAPDAPGYPEADTLYPFGHGLSYSCGAGTCE